MTDSPKMNAVGADSRDSMNSYPTSSYLTSPVNEVQIKVGLDYSIVSPNRMLTLIHWVCLMHQMGASAGVVTVQLTLLGLYMRDKRCHCYMT